MQRYELFGIQTKLDQEATKAWYALSEGWNCSCEHCRNFLAIAKQKLLPPELLKVLDKLEISPEKATYVCEMYPTEHGFCYQFSYRIAGKILQESDSDIKTMPWGQVRCGHEPYPYGAPDFPEPHFDLEFWIDLPWILEERLQRIIRMETIYDRSCAAIEHLQQALQEYLDVEKELAELETYYQGAQWLADFDADRAGEIPKNMKRGVLTEDAIYDLLTEKDNVMRIMKKAVKME